MTIMWSTMLVPASLRDPADRLQFGMSDFLRRNRHSELVEAFNAIRGRTMQFAEATTCCIHDHFFPHFIFKELDCYQWLIMIGLHADRHILQMEEVKAARASGAI